MCAGFLCGFQFRFACNPGLTTVHVLGSSDFVDSDFAKITSRCMRAIWDGTSEEASGCLHHRHKHVLLLGCRPALEAHVPGVDFKNSSEPAKYHSLPIGRSDACFPRLPQGGTEGVRDGGRWWRQLHEIEWFRALLLANSQPRLHSQTGDTVVLVMSDARSIAVADGVTVPPLDPEVLGVSSVPGSVRCLCSAGSTGTPRPDIDNAQFLQHTCDGTLVREDCGCADIDVWSQLRSAVHCSDHGGYGGRASAAPENERSLDIKTDTHITTQHLPLLRNCYRQAFPFSEHVL